MVLEFKNNDPLYFTNAMTEKIVKMVKKYVGYTGDNVTYHSSICFFFSFHCSASLADFFHFAFLHVIFVSF